MKLYLVRHGLTEAYERHLYYGSTDVPLSENGREALRRVKAPRPEVERFITSGMVRTEETLRLLWGDVPAETEPELRELDFGIFEMMGYEDVKNDPVYQEWISGDWQSHAPPGGESWRQMSERVMGALRRIFADGRSAAAVVHGGVIACAMEELFPEEHKNMYEWIPEPGTGYEIEWDEKARRGTWRTWGKETETVKDDWRNKKPEECHYSFVQHTACEFFPCHKTDHPEDFNCLFCYCPLYTLGSKCGGNFRYLDNGHKDCSNCLVPHRRSSYSYIISKYPELAELAKKNR